VVIQVYDYLVEQWIYRVTRCEHRVKFFLSKCFTYTYSFDYIQGLIRYYSDTFNLFQYSKNIEYRFFHIIKMNLNRPLLFRYVTDVKILKI